MNSRTQTAMGKPQPQMADGSVLARVSSQLRALEKRDFELWIIIILGSTLVAAGLLATLAPAAFTNGNLHVQVTVPEGAFVALVAVLVLMNVYLISRRVQLRRTRQRLISTTLQSELARLQSFTDPLTEVYNRRALEDLVHSYTSRAQRLRTQLSFLRIDVDRFRDVNARFGYLTGDIVLAEIASLLRSCVRGADALVRLEEDEFLLILADATAEGAAHVAARISRFLEDWNKGQHLRDFKVRLNIGTADWHEHMTLEDVLSTANQDMYADKRTHRN